jgi:hypothetical protein
MFSKVINLASAKRIALIFWLIFFSYYLVELYFNGIRIYFNNVSTLGSVVIIFLSLLYYYSIFKIEENINIIKLASFWFVTGVFFYYTVGISTEIFFKQLVALRIKSGISVRYLIMSVLIIILYACWIKAFLCHRQKKMSI